LLDSLLKSSRLTQMSKVILSRLGNKFVHLTNYSIQKNHLHNKGKDVKDQSFFEENGSKLTLTRLRARLKYLGISFGTSLSNS
jgi:hypothetical protein